MNEIINQINEHREQFDAYIKLIRDKDLSRDTREKAVFDAQKESIAIQNRINILYETMSLAQNEALRSLGLPWPDDEKKEEPEWLNEITQEVEA